MQHFDNDYMEGALPLILERLMATNMDKTVGYGCDEICASAREKIRQACGAPDAEVHFLVGGTQTNATVIRALLRPHEGVIAADTGHVALHEAGAIEAGGHKVLTIPHQNGKLSAEAIDHYIESFRDEAWDHMVWPGMVYISQPTEYGTIYSLSELEAIAAVCRKWQIPLFADGARLGYGRAAEGADFTLKDLARLCDVFYIGGTKVGAMFGEAVVVPRAGLIPHFFTIIKQQGALLAKGRMLGIQFDTLFTDELYLKIARHAVEQATRLREALVAKGFQSYYNSPTNQVFMVLSEEQLQSLRRCTTFSEWEHLEDGRTVIRLATSWATRAEDIDELIAAI